MAKKSKAVQLTDPAPDGMVWYQSEGECEKARGETFNPPKMYPYKYLGYKQDDSGQQAMVKAGDTLSLEQQVNVRNEQKGLKARNQAQNDMLDKAGIVKKTAANDVQIQLKEAFDLLMLKKNADGTPKFTVEAARARAAEFVGEEWDEE